MHQVANHFVVGASRAALGLMTIGALSAGCLMVGLREPVFGVMAFGIAGVLGSAAYNLRNLRS